MQGCRAKSNCRTSHPDCAEHCCALQWTIGKWIICSSVISSRAYGKQFTYYVQLLVSFAGLCTFCKIPYNYLLCSEHTRTHRRCLYVTASVSLLRFGNVQLISSGFLCYLIEFSVALSILHCKMCQCLTNENK